MKSLTSLILSDTEIGDQGTSDVINACRSFCTIEYLDISGNNLGKSPAVNELAETLNIYLTNNRNLETLKMNWNSLRGAPGEKIVEAIRDCPSLRELYLNNNLLGVSYEEKQPPINKLSEFLQTAKFVEYVDISYNCVDQKSIFCLAHGLKYAQSLQHLNVEGNPIGPAGMRLLISTMS